MLKISISIVYYADNVSDLINEKIEEISNFIPAERIKKSKKYRIDTDRKNCIISYFLLAYGMSSKFNIKKFSEIKYNRFKKPYFKNENFFFNISHTENAVCCGISDKEIGTDIQKNVNDYEKICEIVMSESEIKRIKSSENPGITFTSLWALKESFYKYKGTGINDNLKELDYSRFYCGVFNADGLIYRLECNENYCLSACSEIAPVFIKKDIRTYLDEYKYLL